nr:transposase [Streptomyces sp. NBC_00830]
MPKYPPNRLPLSVPKEYFELRRGGLKGAAAARRVGVSTSAGSLWFIKAGAGVEGTINQALDITGIRRARYRGLPKVRLQHAFSATALNVIRLDAHWTTDPLDRPRHSRLERLSYRLSA